MENSDQIPPIEGDKIGGDASDGVQFAHIENSLQQEPDDTVVKEESLTTPGTLGDASVANKTALYPDVLKDKGFDSVATEELATPKKETEQLNDLLEYTLTVGEMEQLAKDAGRDAPSARTWQRRCEDPKHPLKCLKVKTTTGQEWLGNKESFYNFLKGEPIIERQPTTSHVQEHLGPIAKPSEQGGEVRSVGEVLSENAVLLAKNEALVDKLALVERYHNREVETLQGEITHHRNMQTPADQLLKTIMDQVERIATSGNIARAAEAGFQIESPKPGTVDIKPKPTSAN